MLKGIAPLPGPDLLAPLSAMGHGDEVAIADANDPAQAHARRLVEADVPAAACRPCAFGDDAHKESLFSEVESTITAREPGFSLVPIAGPSFYDRVRAAYAIVASGECRLSGNIILRKGVIRPEGDAP
ncbi:RbsD/FucU family protein [Xanthobacter autotrophicus]|uniref:RbsD/FucU family protein n=1 Tax=Xanthobacter autotrophicus TaxID=280 RepID=UPI0024A71893|nr:RbsD/FucU domain-containing protein [Xanthobacter autotrophicus]MDI4657697.1 transporter [Xanthobacter autotrophicus]